MKQVQRLYLFLQKPFFSDYRTLFGLWLLLPVIATLLKLSKHNNFLIFRYVYWHTIEQLPLYVAYDDYWDTNHYGDCTVCNASCTVGAVFLVDRFVPVFVLCNT